MAIFSFTHFLRLKSFKAQNFSVQSACKVCSISIKIRKWSVMICPNLQMCGPADHFWGMQLLMSSLWQAFSILACQLLSHNWSVSVCQLSSFKPTRAAKSKCISVRQAPFSFPPPMSRFRAQLRETKSAQQKPNGLATHRVERWARSADQLRVRQTEERNDACIYNNSS